MLHDGFLLFGTFDEILLYLVRCFGTLIKFYYVLSVVLGHWLNSHREDVNSYIAQGLGHDPTLPRAPDWRCPKCQNLGAVYFQLPERVADDAMTLVYVCTNCTFYQVKGKEIRFQQEEPELEQDQEEEERNEEQDEDDVAVKCEF